MRSCWQSAATGSARTILPREARTAENATFGSTMFEVARILTARCGLADRLEIREANALALPFQNGTFDHVWSYAVTDEHCGQGGADARGQLAGASCRRRSFHEPPRYCRYRTRRSR